MAHGRLCGHSGHHYHDWVSLVTPYKESQFFAHFKKKKAVIGEIKSVTT